MSNVVRLTDLLHASASRASHLFLDEEYNLSLDAEYDLFLDAEYEMPAVFGYRMVDSVKGILRLDVDCRRSHSKAAGPPKRQSAVLQSHAHDRGGDQCDLVLHPSCRLHCEGLHLLFTCSDSIWMLLTGWGRSLRATCPAEDFDFK